MRFKRLDLNLLVALDVLLTERNVSRAAEKLFLSQSATSGALARLRDYFGDELLVQVGRKMVLTPRSQELAPKVRAALMQIDRTIIQPPDFDPATVDRTIRIVASDYVVMTELGRAIRNIREKAPGLTISLEPQREVPSEALVHGEVDLLAMPEIYVAEDHPTETYFRDDYSVLAWEENDELGETISEEQFFETPQISMRFAVHTPSFENWFMKNKSMDRKLAAVAGSFAAVPFLLTGTKNIALIQSRLARIYAELMPLKVVPSPVELPPLVEQLQWHTHSSGDECLQWVRQEILDACSG